MVSSIDAEADSMLNGFAMSPKARPAAEGAADFAVIHAGRF
jgi:hypothetical protein